MSGHDGERNYTDNNARYAAVVGSGRCGRVRKYLPWRSMAIAMQKRQGNYDGAMLTSSAD